MVNDLRQGEMIGTKSVIPIPAVLGWFRMELRRSA